MGKDTEQGAICWPDSEHRVRNRLSLVSPSLSVLALGTHRDGWPLPCPNLTCQLALQRLSVRPQLAMNFHARDFEDP